MTYLLIEAQSSISQTSQSLCSVNNYSASNYKNSLTAWRAGNQCLDGRAANIQRVRVIALWH